MGHVNRPADSWADTSGAPPTALLCGNEAQAPGPAPPPLHAPTWSISVLFNNFRIKSPFSAVGWVTMGRGWKPHLGPQIATEPSWVASINPGLVTVQTWLQGPGLARRHQLSEGQQLRAGAAQQVMALHRLWLLLHLWRHKRQPGLLGLGLCLQATWEWEEGVAGRISGVKSITTPPS